MVAASVHASLRRRRDFFADPRCEPMSAAALLCAAALGFRIQEPESGEERRLQDDSDTYSGTPNFCDSNCAQDYMPFLTSSSAERDPRSAAKCDRLEAIFSVPLC